MAYINLIDCVTDYLDKYSLSYKIIRNDENENKITVIINKIQEKDKFYLQFKTNLYTKIHNYLKEYEFPFNIDLENKNTNLENISAFETKDLKYRITKYNEELILHLNPTEY